MATEISTWEELIATTAGTEYIWTGGNLNFDDIQPSGFTTPITINGSIDFNGAVFFNFRSMSSRAIISTYSGNNKQYLKNLTFQNVEHIPQTLTYGIFLEASGCDLLENFVITGTVQGIERTSRYSLVKVLTGSNTRHRLDRFGCDLVIKLGCPFFMTTNSPTSDPSTGTDYRITIYDGRIKLDLEYNGTKQPIPHELYNCKLSGKIKNNNESASGLTLDSYFSAISLSTEMSVTCPNLNLVRTDLATYEANPQLVRCDSPFWEHKAEIAASGFPYGE